MGTNRKLKKKISAMLDSSEKPFETWAEEHGIDITLSPEKEKPKLKSKKSFKHWVFVAVPALFIAVAVILPTTLLNKGKPSTGVQEPKIYSYIDVESTQSSIAELIAVENVCMFDLSKAAQSGIDQLVFKDVLKEDNSKIMSFYVEKLLVSVERNGSAAPYYISYRVRLYENYNFLYSEDFLNLQKVFDYDDKTIKYDILNSKGGYTAYSRFIVGDYEYFFEAQGFKNITEVNEESFKFLIGQLF